MAKKPKKDEESRIEKLEEALESALDQARLQRELKDKYARDLTASNNRRALMCDLILGFDDDPDGFSEFERVQREHEAILHIGRLKERSDQLDALRSGK